MRVVILGCGSSPGTPDVYRGWGECDPENPKNRRRRPSILVEHNGVRILVDSSPDLREQLLSAGVRELDAVFYTHYHADHLHGIDDLRAVNRVMGRALDIHADRQTIKVIESRFGYVFEPLAEDVGVIYKPLLTPHEIGPGDVVSVGSKDSKGSVEVRVFGQDHGYCDTLGFRFGDLAYSTDLVRLPEESFAALEGVDTWIIGTLVDFEHPTHVHVAKALQWAERVGVGRVVLTHMSGMLDYGRLAERLAGWTPGSGAAVRAEPAYDGMVIEAGD